MAFKADFTDDKGAIFKLMGTLANAGNLRIGKNYAQMCASYAFLDCRIKPRIASGYAPLLLRLVQQREFSIGVACNKDGWHRALHRVTVVFGHPAGIELQSGVLYVQTV